MKIIGIDPGITGALASIIDGRLDEVIDMPVLDGRADGRQLYEMFSFWNATLNYPIKAYIEQVHAMPTGTVANFSMGYNLATVITAAQAAAMSIVRVLPTKWKPTYNLGGKGRDPDAGRLLAREMYPDACEFLNRKKDHGRSDAILIARYGYLQEVGAHEAHPSLP